MNQIDRYAHFNGKRSTDAGWLSSLEKTLSWEGASLCWWSVCMLSGAQKIFQKFPLAILFEIGVTLALFLAEDLPKMCVKSGSFWRFLWEKDFQNFICSISFAFENKSHSGTFHRKKITYNYFCPLYLTLPSETSYVTVERAGTISLGKLTTRCLLFQRNIICCLNFSKTSVWQTFQWEGWVAGWLQQTCRQTNKQVGRQEQVKANQRANDFEERSLGCCNFVSRLHLIACLL